MLYILKRILKKYYGLIFEDGFFYWGVYLLMKFCWIWRWKENLFDDLFYVIVIVWLIEVENIVMFGFVILNLFVLVLFEW